MVRKCAFPNCKSGYSRPAKDPSESRAKITVFKFPDDPDLRRLWVEQLNKKKEWQVGRNSGVCALHFAPEEVLFDREDRHSLRALKRASKRSKPRLKSGAIPRSVTPCPETMTTHILANRALALPIPPDLPPPRQRLKKSAGPEAVAKLRRRRNRQFASLVAEILESQRFVTLEDMDQKLRGERVHFPAGVQESSQADQRVFFKLQHWPDRPPTLKYALIMHPELNFSLWWEEFRIAPRAVEEWLSLPRRIRDADEVRLVLEFLDGLTEISETIVVDLDEKVD